mgnify:CR=1 FL=1
MDIQIIIDAYKKYAKYKDKNLIQLMEFSKLARVERKSKKVYGGASLNKFNFVNFREND